MNQFVYLGKTEGTIFQRHFLNFSLIHNQKPNSVALHLFCKGHSVNDFEVVGLEKKYAEMTIERLRKQKPRTYKSYYINTKE